MDLLEQSVEHILIVATRTHGSVRESTAQRGGNAGLIKQRIDLDNSTFHAILA